MHVYSGFHFQRPVNDWPRAAAQLPAETWIKFIDNVQALDEAKRVNPGLKTVLRHFDGGWQRFDFANHAERRGHARLFLLSFVDGTFLNYAHNVDAIEELNEYNASSHSAVDVQKRVDWVRAVSEEWASIKASDSRLSHIRLVVGNVAIGNDLPLEAARLVQQYGNIAGYHPYVPTRGGVIRPDEWRWYSGRWTEMDARFQEAGITVDWLFTEAGPIGYTGDHLGPNDGWRHPDVCNGDVNALLAVCRYWMDRTAEWNYTHGGRALGQVLYNSGGADNEWRLFEIAQPEMDVIAAFNRDYVAPPPPVIEPPPPPDNIPLPARIIDYVDQLPMNTESDDWPYATRPLSAITDIIVHHSVGQPTNPPESIAIGHINRNGGGADGWPGIGYHFYILGDGTIYKTNYLTTHSYHAGTSNRSSIGMCLAGDFTSVHPPQSQLEAARFLIAWLQDVLGQKGLLKHRDVAATQCPGNTWDEWWAQLTEEPPPPEPEPRRYHRTTHVAPQDATLEEWLALATLAYPNRQSVMFSADDAFAKPPEITGRTPIIWDVERVAGSEQALRDWVNVHYAPWPVSTEMRRLSSLFAPRYASPVGTAAERASGDIWPGEWVDANPYLNFYVYGSNDQYSAYHSGSDLNLNSPTWNADRGMAVHAMGAGVVTYARLVPAPSTWGRLVVINHGDGLCSRYAHMATMLVAEGQRLDCGDVIGTIGGTQYGVADHLHFDICVNGRLFTNPTDWPGTDRARVVRDYVNPRDWLRENV